MRWIFVFLVLVSCHEEDLKFCMEISSAQPITFWLNGQQSFNTKTVAGIDKKCFFQPFNTDSNIRIQVLEDTGYNFYLEILNSQNEIIQTIDVPEISTGVYELDFTASTYSLDGLYQMRVKKRYYLLNSEFVSDLDGWSNVGTGTDWVWNSANSGCAQLTGTGPFSAKSLSKSITFPSQTANLVLNASTQITGAFGTMPVSFLNSGGSTIYSTADLANGSNSISINYSDISTAASIRVRKNEPGIGVSYTFRLNSIDLYIDYGIVFSSDFLDIFDNLANISIQYSNENDFAGLDYSTGSVFTSVVRGKFFKERFPEENESESLSDGSVEKLSGSVKKQKLLQIEPCPYYMHEKLKLILQHNYILIDGLLWEKEENYEMSPLNEKNPFELGSVWLTQKQNSYFTNVYGVV